MKALKNDYIETQVAGIPCIAEITYYNHVEPWSGSAYTCPSDMDYYGYTDVEFQLRDRKGYVAKWLENKMSDKDKENIEQEIIEYMGSGLEDY
jgi:hypothetical protein